MLSSVYVPLAQELAAQPELTVDILVVLGVVTLALTFFLIEWLPVDVTAILLIVILVVLEPLTGIDSSTGISGFANDATITVLAMLILSGGIARTGLVQELGRRMAAFAGDNIRKQLFATVLATSPASGFLNNTPVVALLVPVVTDLASRGNTSPSKLLIPLSYAAQVGGMLTLIGSSTNILASDISARLGSEYPELHRFSMFEFTQLGVIVVVVGALYLIFIGHYLLPERVPPHADYAETYEASNYIVDVEIVRDSPLIGGAVGDATELLGAEVDSVQAVRDGDRLATPRQETRLEFGGDRLAEREAATRDGQDEIRINPSLTKFFSEELSRFRSILESARCRHRPEETRRESIQRQGNSCRTGTITSVTSCRQYRLDRRESSESIIREPTTDDERNDLDGPRPFQFFEGGSVTEYGFPQSQDGRYRTECYVR